MTDPRADILATCERLARRGELYHVSRYRYRDDQRRRLARRLARAGLLVLAGQDRDGFYYYRPEDESVLVAHIARESWR